MGRKNQRLDTFVPLDLTPAEIPKPRKAREGNSWLDVRENQAIAYDDREKRQREARVDKGIDWSVCVVPGCGQEYGIGVFRHVPEADRRDSTLELPICYQHAAVVVEMVLPDLVTQGRFIEAVADIRDGVAARRKVEAADAQTKFLARQDGDIYFIRIGELIKVGWTRDLWSRLKSYGASAELLVSYPGTHQDETTLHRQLTPARVKGREWYEDGQVIALYVQEALSKYGPPETFDGMWTKPKKIVAGKRH